MEIILRDIASLPICKRHRNEIVGDGAYVQLVDKGHYYTTGLHIPIKDTSARHRTKA